jgi:hypothetical protein
MMRNEPAPLPLEGEGVGGWGGGTLLNALARKARKTIDGAHSRPISTILPPPHPTLPVEGRA